MYTNALTPYDDSPPIIVHASSWHFVCPLLQFFFNFFYSVLFRWSERPTPCLVVHRPFINRCTVSKRPFTRVVRNLNLAEAAERLPLHREHRKMNRGNLFACVCVLFIFFAFVFFIQFVHFDRTLFIVYRQCLLQ